MKVHELCAIRIERARTVGTAKRLAKAVVGNALWSFRLGIMPRPRQRLLKDNRS